jgi:hypothetical protein
MVTENADHYPHFSALSFWLRRGCVGQIAGEILVFSSNHVTFHLFLTDSILFDRRDNNHKVE